MFNPLFEANLIFQCSLQITSVIARSSSPWFTQTISTLGQKSGTNMPITQIWWKYLIQWLLDRKPTYRTCKSPRNTFFGEHHAPIFYVFMWFHLSFRCWHLDVHLSVWPRYLDAFVLLHSNETHIKKSETLLHLYPLVQSSLVPPGNHQVAMFEKKCRPPLPSKTKQKWRLALEKATTPTIS